MKSKFLNIKYALFIVGLFFCIKSFGQYDEGFTKPIITENGNFVYYELAPIQTSEGVLVR